VSDLIKHVDANVGLPDDLLAWTLLPLLRLVYCNALLAVSHCIYYADCRIPNFG